VQAGPIEDAVQDDRTPGFAQWRYYRRRGEREGPLYVQRLESWVELSPFGVRSSSPGAIPPSLRDGLEEVPRSEAEAEIDKRDCAFRRNPVQIAHDSGRWYSKLRLTLPGIPAFLFYLLAILWSGDFWPPTSVDFLTLLPLTILPIVIGAFVASLLWASRAGDEAWWAGGLFGSLALFAVFLAFCLDKPPFVWSSLILGAMVGFALGSFAGLLAQRVADRLERRHRRGYLTELQAWHVAGAASGLGALLALVAALRFYF
jgi:hypothetical protein